MVREWGSDALAPIQAPYISNTWFELVAKTEPETNQVLHTRRLV